MDVSTGEFTGGLLVSAAGGKEAGALDEGAGAAGEEAGAEGALAELYPVTEQPDFATSSAGQVTTSQSTLIVSVIEFREREGLMYVGLSAPCIQSQRNPQPGCSAVGNEVQVLEDGPPYCTPQTAEVAFHSVEQPSNCPKPPPGICLISHDPRSGRGKELTARSNCVLPTSSPVFVACTIIFFPLRTVLVNVSW